MQDQDFFAAEDAAYARLARELHDNLNAHFVSLNIALSPLPDEVEKLRALGMGELADRLKWSIDVGLEATRLSYSYVHSLADGRSHEISDPMQALRRAVDVLAYKRQKMSVKLSETLDYLQVLPPAKRTDLTLIAKEALMNSMKYSGASELFAGLTISDGMLVLQVRDNGQGQGDAMVKGSGIGMKSMAWRADRIGGEFAVEWPESGGCVVRVSLQLGPDLARLSVQEP